MLSRRTFLRTSTLSTLAVPLLLRAEATPPAGTPLVVATWPNRGATEAGWQRLQSGGTALDAVEAGARVPEADPNETSVGHGGLPDRDGHVTLDACIMDWKGNAGAVTFLEGIMHPISVARRVMEKTPHVMLSGAGALQFAVSEGFVKKIQLTSKARKAWEAWKKTAKYQPKINVENHDTIGILSLDQQGHVSGACSTSGLAYKMHGRVGDSPIIGAGMFVDDEVGAACATGLGEFVMKTLGSFLVVELMRQGRSPQQACEEAIGRIVKRYPNYPEFQVGYLATNKQGDVGAYAIQPGFSYTLTRDGKTTIVPSDSHLKK
ncbi:MAG: N(4)-(beta-N-acetylglucosaminyl)-L-asparaginase [Cytophagaceae bacterium]|nr:N(4)-(beta-N-acetylglucosaminyl)-L-asparaginase [Cytophagaceae bacterium]